MKQDVNMNKHLWVVSILLLLCGICYPDALVVTKAMTASTIAEYYVDDEGIRLELEVGANDLAAFRNLLPDELYQKLNFEPEPFAKRLVRFFGEDLVILDDEQKPLFGQVIQMEPRKRIIRDDITGQPLPVQPEDAEFTVFAELKYTWDKQPSSLTFISPGRADPSKLAAVGFVVYHENLPVNDFRYLGAPETLNLNWEDPWYSAFGNRNLRRQYYSPIQGFLYVENFEVRKEIILRPLDLQHWIDLGLNDKETIPIDEQEALKEKVSTFLATRCPVTIDGQPVDLQLDRIHFIQRSLKMTGVIDPPQDLPTISATLGVIYVTSIDKLPQEATMEWDLFNDKVPQVPTVATDEAGGLPYSVSPDDPILKWQNFLKNPTVPSFAQVMPPKKPLGSLAIFLILVCSVGFGTILLHSKLSPAKFHQKWVLSTMMGIFLLIGGAGSYQIWTLVPSSEEAREISLGLLKNIYHAFDFQDESVIYDTLQRSVEGDLLTQIYLEVQDSLALENQGGAKVKVKQVDLTETQVRPLPESDGFTARCSWVVTGSVGHWGHIHQRKNAYQATLHIEPFENSWKITNLYLENEQRL
jgi:hypothetical protein